MATVQCLRQFVSERLTAAAEEIFGVFEKTITAYEEEIDRQRRLLEIVWKPEIKLQKIELQQQRVGEQEEGLSEEKPWKPIGTPSPEQETSQIKEEQSDNPGGEQPKSKQEINYFMLTPNFVECDDSEGQSLNLSSDGILSGAEDRPFCDTSAVMSVAPQISGGENKDCGNVVHSSAMSVIHNSNDRTEKPFGCDTCGKAFRLRCKLQKHLKIHTDERPYACDICGRRFRFKTVLTRHMMIHTGEKRYFCHVCGRGFIQRTEITIHLRSHTGEKPYVCNICGKRFNTPSSLNRHVRIHNDRSKKQFDR